MKKIDYEMLFRSSPYPYLVMDTDLTVLDANHAYLKATGAAHSEIIGKYVFDAFPENPDDPGSTNIAEVKGSLERAIATGLADTTPFLRYAIPNTRAGSSEAGDINFDERYWSTTSTPIPGPDGQTLFVVQNPVDVTDLYSFNKANQVALIDSKIKDLQITEDPNRAQMHEAMLRILSDERGYMRNLFNLAPGFVAVLSGPTHVFRMVNEAYYQLVGHRSVIGKPVWEALPEVKGQGFEELLDNVYNTGKVWVGRSMPIVVQPQPDGPFVTRYVDLLYQPVFEADGSVSGIFAQGHDVTETYEAQMAHREIEERLREGMMAARMVVWDWNLGDRSAIFSENALSILGGLPTTIDGFIQLLHPEDRSKAEQALHRALTVKSDFQETLRMLRPDTDEIIWIDLRGKIRPDEKSDLALRGVALDVTDRVRATESLRFADRQKDEFLAMLAHELRNPLAPISSAAQLLTLTNPSQAQLTRTGEIIERQIKHLVGLVDDLLDVSRVTRGLISTDMGVVDLKHVIYEAIEQGNPLIQARLHRVNLDITPDEVRIIGDHKRMVQVLTNLLINAAKYTPNGGKINVQLALEAEFVSLKVIDNGVGISPELMPRIFELFTQAERTADRSQGGLGIGLALVKSLVEIHGGTIKAFSDEDMKGSRFEILLPRIDLNPAQPDPQTELSGGAMKILVVDDNEDAADSLALVLETLGHETSVEYTARSAIERAVGEGQDVFLLDIGLPEMDGNALVRYLRAQPETAKALMVAVTGYGAEENRKEAMAAGFDEYLVKPVDIGALDQLITGYRQSMNS